MNTVGNLTNINYVIAGTQLLKTWNRTWSSVATNVGKYWH